MHRTPDPPADPIAFGRFVHDERRGLLLCDGQPVQLHARTLRVLGVLLAHAGQVVSRETLLAEAWPGVTVVVNNLTVQIGMLREALAAHGAEPTLIRTIQGQGYSFTGRIGPPPPDPGPAGGAPVDAADPALPPHTPTRWVWRLPTIARPFGARPLGAALLSLLVVACLGLVLHRRHPARPLPPAMSIAVVPFRALDAQGGYMADAITDDLTTDLSQIPGAVVIAREAAQAYAGPSFNPAAIGRALNVRSLLHGSVALKDGSYRINAWLTQAATGRDLWSQRFDVPAGRLADAQTDIVRRIASALDVQLTDLAVANPLQGSDRAPDAQTLFLRGRSALEHDDSPAGYTQAETLLKQALALQPDDGDIQAQLALTLVQKVRSYTDPDALADLADADRLVTQALHMPPAPPLAWAADARLAEAEGQCPRAILSADNALAQYASSIDALAVLARCKANQGLLDEAAAAEDQLLRLNPATTRSRPRFLLLAQIRLLQGRYQETLDLVGQANADLPEAPETGAASVGRPSMDRVEYGQLILIAACQLIGQTDRARRLYTQYAQEWPLRTVWRVAAYSPRIMAALPGFARFTAALHVAGMPPVADEHAAAALPPDPASLTSDFVALPAIIPGARSLDTAGLATLLVTGSGGLAVPLLLDLGRGAAVPSGAMLAAFDGRQRASLKALVGPDRRRVIVVLGSGVSDPAGWRAVGSLVRQGYTAVSWYRGGEEAWAAAGQPYTDRRPET